MIIKTFCVEEREDVGLEVLNLKNVNRKYFIFFNY